ncbi:MAG: serine/threonine-protein phosphatase [Clostridiales bacterium]|nr:serine/threonine-protein phosphatase [Clostridiales bacterium]
MEKKKHKHRKTKLIVEILAAALPFFIITVGLVSFVLYRGMMDSFIKAKEELMDDDLEVIYKNIFYHNIDWFWDAAESDPDLVTSEITPVEQAYYDSYCSRVLADNATVDPKDRDIEWFNSLENDYVRNYYVKETMKEIRDECEWEMRYGNGKYSTIFLIDPREGHQGFVFYNICDYHGTALNTGDTGVFDLADYPVVQKRLSENASTTFFDTCYDFPQQGIYYVAYKPIMVEGKIRAFVGIGYFWADFLEDVLKILLGLALSLLWGLGIVFAVIFVLVYLRAVRPAENMQKSVREYTRTKDGKALLSNMKYRTFPNEFGRLSRDIADLAEEIDEYTREIVTFAEEKERVSTELDMAKNIQRSQLPGVFPPFPERSEFDIYASMTPAKEVGGDFYDFFFVDDDHLALVMADVSGKGVPAALFMMISKVLIHNYAMLGLSPHEVIEKTNASICENNDAKMFVTVWFGILEISTGKVTACNAGHEYPVISRNGGVFELFKDKHGFVVGGIADKKYTDYVFILGKGETLFVYTDGVPEATDSSNNLYGTDRLIAAMNAAVCSTPQDLLNKVHEDVSLFAGDAPQFDDLTMMAVKLIGEGQSGQT